MSEQQSCCPGTESALLPCPFCGESDVGFGRTGQKWQTVACNECGAEGPCTEIDHDLIVKKWNTRAVAQASEDWHEDFRRRTRALSQGSDAQAAIEQAEVDVSPDIESSKTAPLNRCISVPVSLIRALRDRLQQEDSFVWLDEIQMLDAALSAVPPSPGAGEWDKGEHEGCGIDSQRTMVRFDSQLAMQQVLEFLNSIEGAGYGGMASFEIAREYVRTLAVSSTTRATPIDHSDEECPNFPGCHCVDQCCDGWKHPSPEIPSTEGK